MPNHIQNILLTASKFRSILSKNGDKLNSNFDAFEKKINSLIKSKDQAEKYFENLFKEELSDVKDSDYLNYVKLDIKEKFKRNNNNLSLTKLTSKSNNTEEEDYCYNSHYYVKLIRKIVVRIREYTNVFKNTEDMLAIKELKKNDLVSYYCKMVDFFLSEVYTYIYKVGSLFYSNKATLKKLNKLLISIIKKFVQEMNKKVIFLFEKNSTVKISKENLEILEILDFSLISHRASRYLEISQIKLIFMSIEKPINVYYSKETFLQILSEIKASNLRICAEHLDYNGEEEKYEKECEFIFERDVRIFDNYGVKVDDLEYGFVIYEESLNDN